MSDSISILLIEGDAVDQMAFSNLAATEGLPYRIEISRSAAEARRALTDRTFDLILAASELPDGKAFDLFDLLAGKLVLITACSGDEETAARALALGIRDYVIKDPERHYLKMLPHRIEISRRQWQAEKQLSASEERFRTLSNAAFEGIVISENGRILDANDQALAMFRAERSEMLGRAILEFVAPTSLAAVAEAVQTGAEVLYEHHLQRTDGTVFLGEARARILKVGDRRIRMAALRDITERKAVEENLKESLSLLEGTLESTADGILVADGHGRIVRFNRKFAEMWRLPAEVLVSGSDDAALHCVLAQLNEPERFLDKVQELYTQPESTSFDVLAFKDGRVFERYSQPQRLRENIVGRVWSFRDVTERKENEEEIRRLAAFPQVNPNPVFELTEEGAIHYYNAAAAGLASQLGFVHPGEMLPPSVPGIVRECLAARAGHSRLETSFGQRVVAWSFYPIPDRGVVHCYATEVTEQRQLAGQLRQVQKMESIGQLAAGIAHDFNNLLTVIHGYSDLLQEELADRPRAAECVEQIGVASERAANLTRQLLLFSRKQVAQRRRLDLNELAGNLTKMLQRTLGEEIALRLRRQPGLPLVHADPGMIEQIIINLSVNARDAMPGGGRLEISTSVAELDAARVCGNLEARPGRFVCLGVSDTGSGIPPEIVQRIFEPFFTTKEVGKGTGLGLATVYGIVMQHQGVVEVANRPGQGACFHVYLPVAPYLEETAADTLVTAPAHGRGETILLVEDEEMVLTLVEMLLGQAGYKVLTACSGVAALRVWEEHAEKIDLLLTDMVMPEALNGKQLAERLRIRQPGLRVIFMSGYSPDLRAGELGMEEGLNFLQKPFTGPVLLQAVRRQLDTAG